MKQHLNHFASAVLLILALGCGTRHKTEQVQPSSPNPAQSPFSVSVVPTRSQEEPYGRAISMAKTSHDDFYVILTNISKEHQAAFESWNSWGYQAVSFEVETPDGKKFAISKRPQGFTMNFPSTFDVPPGEHMVYPIQLDDQWVAIPPLPMADATPIAITIRAIYEIKATPEAAKGKVWIGRLPSSGYHFYLRHW